jgi:DNA modification methylase
MPRREKPNCAFNHLKVPATAMVAIDLLKPFERNARTHSKKQIEQVAASIETFGFVNPVLTAPDGRIIAGHCRVAAARLLGYTEVSTVCIDHLTPEQLRAYVIADNKLAELAGWDQAILGAELADLLSLELPFNLEVTGFSTAEIDGLTLQLDGEDASPGELLPADGPAVTRHGETWIMGDHRLICGDSTQAETHQALMENDRARLVFSDPPYNVPIDGHVGGKGRVKHREFAMASGEMSSREFTDFLASVFRQLVNVSHDGALHFQCMDWRHMDEMLSAGRQSKLSLLNLAVWVKDNGGMGSLYRSRHELVFVWKAGQSPHVNTVELGRYGRNRTNVWEYAGVNTLKKGRLSELAMHPTVKPLAMVQDAIRDTSRAKEVVLDPFGGSGTTLIAAERTGRRAKLIEIDPCYCDVIVRRWQKFTGKSACLSGTTSLFDDIAQMRVGSLADEEVK